MPRAAPHVGCPKSGLVVARTRFVRAPVQPAPGLAWRHGGVGYRPVMRRTSLAALVGASALVCACAGDATGAGGQEGADGSEGADEAGDGQGDESGGMDGGADGGDEGPSPDMGPATCEVEPLAQWLGDAMVDVPAEMPVGPCGHVSRSIVAAKGQVLDLEVSSDGVDVEVVVVYPDDPDGDGPAGDDVMPGWSVAAGETVTEGLVMPRSGELMVAVRHGDNAAGEATVTLRCKTQCDKTSSRFPTLLVHGWTGFENIGPITYFFGVLDHVTQLGYPAQTVVLDPYNAIAVRGEQLADHIDEQLEVWRARRVNLVAHSQGGLDSRYALSSLGYGDRVAALVTISTPHQGTPLTDVALGILPGASEQILATLLNLVGAGAGQESDAMASFEDLSEAHVQDEFNPENPDVEGVYYESWAGRTCLLGITCDDVCDLPIQPTFNLLTALRGANDGIVPVESAKWGEYRGEIPADHFDEVGQIAGQTSPNFDHLEFYAQRLGDLTSLGY